MGDPQRYLEGDFTGFDDGLEMGMREKENQ